jgi:hypothetical protein
VLIEARTQQAPIGGTETDDMYHASNRLTCDSGLPSRVCGIV